MQIGGGGFILVMAGAVLLPRMLAHGAGGLEAAATAAITFLALFAMALAVAVYILLVALRQRTGLSAMARAAGWAPMILWLLCLAILAYVVRARTPLPKAMNRATRAVTVHAHTLRPCHALCERLR